MKKTICLIVLMFSIIGFSVAIIVNPILVNGKDYDKDGNKIAKANNNQSAFTVVPSQQNDKISIVFAESAKVSSVKMINNHSNIVYQATKSRGASNVLDIPIEDMEAGTYFIRVQTDKGISVERIIISK